MGEKTQLLQRLINAADVRQSAISQNIVNVHTPGYKTQEVRFEDQLASELKRKQSSALGQTEPQLSAVQNLKARNDGNNVDIDREVGQMGKNALMMQTYLRMIGSEVQMMRDAMEGG